MCIAVPVRGVALAVALAALAGCGGGGGGGGGAGGTAVQPIVLSTFQAADVVIGQTSFAGAAYNQGNLAAADTLAGPIGAPAPGSLYVPDSANSRILGFASVPTASDASADFVIGQSGFAGSGSGTSASRLKFPSRAVTANGRLFVTDTGNNRVLIWNTLPTGNVPADVVVGAPDFTTVSPSFPLRTTLDGPVGLAVAGGRLFVADTLNSRVLIWNTIPTVNGAPADVVLGEPDFTSNSPSISSSALNSPEDVWSDGVRVVVADTGNHRVLIWNTVPTTNFPDADVVIGQPNFNTNFGASGAQGLTFPYSVDSNGSQLFVADYGNSRVLVFDTFPTASQPSADIVLGQSDFTHAAANDDNQDGFDDGAPSARTLRTPSGVRIIGDSLFVAAPQNNRVLIYHGQ